MQLKTALPYIIVFGFMVFLYSCEPRTQSILQPAQKVTRSELSCELDIIEKTMIARIDDIERQEQLRELIFNNATYLAQGGQFNPLAILTAAASIYGVTSAGRDAKKAVIKKLKPS